MFSHKPLKSITSTNLIETKSNPLNAPQSETKPEVVEKAKALGYEEKENIYFTSDDCFRKEKTLGQLLSNEYIETAKPTHQGMLLLADYYLNKLNIQIIPLPTKENVNDEDPLCKEIQKIRSSGISKCKVGFIYDPERGHGIPIVYEKNDDKETLFAFNSTGESKIYLNFPGLFSKTEIYISTDLIQTDYSSCYNYAFFILKEALQIENLKDALRNIEKIETPSLPHERYFSCQIPILFLKGSQLSKAISTSNFSYTVKKNGETLEQHRNRYSRPIKVKIKEKILVYHINIYIKKYGYDNRKRIAKEYIRQITNSSTHIITNTLSSRLSQLSLTEKETPINASSLSGPEISSPIKVSIATSKPELLSEEKRKNKLKDFLDDNVRDDECSDLDDWVVNEENNLPDSEWDEIERQQQEKINQKSKQRGITAS